MTPAYFTVVWDPTTETATVNTVYETFTDDETVAALDQFVACRLRCAEINGVSVEEEDRCTVCGIKDVAVRMRPGPRTPERTCRACAWLSPTSRAETDDETVDALGG